MGRIEILDYLKDNYPKYYSARSLILVTGLSRASLFSALSRLRKTNYINVFENAADMAKGSYPGRVYQYNATASETLEIVINKKENGGNQNDFKCKA